MKKVIAAVAAVATLGAPAIASSTASAATYAGGAPIVGCQQSNASFEYLNPAVAPTRCTMLYEHTTGTITPDNEDVMHGIRWSHWGRATATATAWWDDGQGPIRVTLKAWGVKTLSGLAAPLANTPLCRDSIRYYSRVTVTMPDNSEYAAGQWTDHELAPIRQC